MGVTVGVLEAFEGSMRGHVVRMLVALAAVTLPVPAWADARDYPGRLGNGAGLRHSGRADFARHHHGHHHRRGPVYVVPGTVLVGPSAAYAAPPPPVYPTPTMVYAPTMIYAPPAAYTPPPTSYAPPPPPAPTAPPQPQVVEFDTGRYELRGDGVREPYTWVWLPKPPSAPPGIASAPRARTTVYRWTDESGVVTLTDDPRKVPPQFRATEIVPR